MAINHGFGLGAINHGYGLGAINHGYGLGAINHGYGLGAINHGFGLGEVSTSSLMLYTVLALVPAAAVGLYVGKRLKKKGKSLAGHRSRSRSRKRRY